MFSLTEINGHTPVDYVPWNGTADLGDDHLQLRASSGFPKHRHEWALPDRRWVSGCSSMSPELGWLTSFTKAVLAEGQWPPIVEVLCAFL